MIAPAGIRRATAADVPAIAHVHVASWRTTYRGIVPQAFLDALDEGARAEQWRGALAGEVLVLVAEHAGAVVGFACAGAAREPQPGYDAELYALYLLKGSQRQGLGRALVEGTARALTPRGYAGMLLWVLEANPACGFYRHLGGLLLGSKPMEIGEATLTEIAFGWPWLALLAGPAPRGA